MSLISTGGYLRGQQVVMAVTDADIYDKEVPNLINKLCNFLGYTNVSQALEKYKQSLSMAGPAYSREYLMKRHPWWKDLLDYRNLENSGKTIYKNLSDGIMPLAGDAKKISILQKNMPESIREKFKQDLLGDEAMSYLFELSIAWHFHLRDYRIDWYQDDGLPHPEFKVVTPEKEFDVECKRISADSFRQMKRKDFYYMIDYLLPKVREMGYCGNIELVLNSSLPSDIRKLKDICSEIILIIKNGKLKAFNQPCSFGQVTLNLSNLTKKEVDFMNMYREMQEQKPHEALGVIYAASYEDRPVDPIEMTCKSKKAEEILKGIRRKIAEATLSQLDKSRPSLVAFFI
ncbi:MAG: hypothetical protein MUO97_04415, partial [Dehalococcoidia bacterium]|nr:hypothetical protein [Dehalococcoidia bacterium]